MNQPKNKAAAKPGRFQVVKLEERIAPSQTKFAPGQFPAGSPGQTPGAGNAPGNSFKGG